MEGSFLFFVLSSDFISKISQPAVNSQLYKTSSITYRGAEQSLLGTKEKTHPF
jgi:hypothetical protein